jgi:hypothetical protein
MELTFNMKVLIFIIIIILMVMVAEEKLYRFFIPSKSSFQDLSDVQDIPGTLNVNSKYAVEALAK